MGVAEVYLRCFPGVARVLDFLFVRGVAKVLEGCYSGVEVVSRWC